MTDYYFAQNDRLPQLKMNLQDQVDSIDLTNAVSVKVYVEFPTGVKEYAMTIAPNQSTSGKGDIQYDFVADDIPDPGRHRMRTVVTWSSSRDETFPNDGYDYMNVVEAFVAP